MADQFDAFVSYSRGDGVFAEKLVEALENFTPPPDLSIPQRPLKIFRDVSDLTGNEYFSAIESELRSSRKLILLCSPLARQSSFVDDEIRRFIQAQGAQNIIPVIVNGLPNNEATGEQSALMAFPQALCDALPLPLAVPYREWNPASDAIDAGSFKPAWYTLLADLYGVSRAEIEARDSARRARDRATWSRQLATNSNRAQDIDPELAVLLAANAVKITADADGAVIAEAEEALYRAVENFQRRRTFPLMVLQGHEDAVWDVQYNAAGTVLVTASEDCSWRLWDAATGRQLASVSGTPKHGPVKAAKFSPDGQCLITAHLDGRAKFWTSNAVRSIYLDAHCWDVAYRPDGRAVATASIDGVVKVWDLGTGNTLHSFILPGPAVTVAFSPDGGRLAAGGRFGIAKVWDLVSSQPELNLQGHTEVVHAITFSPDGKQAATASEDGTWRLWELESGQQLAKVDALGSQSARPGEKSLAAVAFDPAGKHLATACRDKTATVWDARSRRDLFTLAGHSGGVWGVAFHPQKDRIATASYDRTVRIWDASQHQELLIRLSGQEDEITALAFEPNSQTLYSGGHGGTVFRWDLAKGEPVHSFQTNQGTVSTIACHPRESIFATADGNGTVSLWNLNGTPVRTLSAHDKSTMSVTFSPDGELLLSAALDGKAKLWEWRTGKFVVGLDGQSEELASALFSPDGSLIATAPTAHEWAQAQPSNTTARLWKSSTRELLLKLEGHSKPLTAMAFSPNGAMLATASFDHTAKLWDTKTGRPIATLVGHISRPTSVAFSRDGSRVATGSIDRTVKLWTIKAKGDSVTLVGHSDHVSSVAFSPDGRWIASAARNGLILLHHVSVNTLINLAEQAVPRQLTSEEAAHYLPGSGVR